jgi:hypothetical protein
MNIFSYTIAAIYLHSDVSGEEINHFKSYVELHNKRLVDTTRSGL